MFSHRISTIASTAIGAAAIGLVALATASTAGASSIDEAFIAQMNTLGITFSSPAEAVGKATRCAGSWPPAKAARTSPPRSSSQTDLTSHQAAYFVVNATKAYCPQLAPQLT